MSIKQLVNGVRTFALLGDCDLDSNDKLRELYDETYWNLLASKDYFGEMGMGLEERALCDCLDAVEQDDWAIALQRILSIL